MGINNEEAIKQLRTLMEDGMFKACFFIEDHRQNSNFFLANFSFCFVYGIDS